jgi:hypothetical protein
MRRHFGYLTWAIMLSCAVSVGQQRPKPPAGPAPVPRIARAQAPIPAPYAGTVEGFVYWDANAIAHQPPSSCGGLAVTVSVGSPTGPFESYKPLGTLSNNFRYVGRVRGVVNGQVVTYDACIYAYDHVPVGPDLQVQLTVTQPSAFSPVVTPQFGTLGPVKIVNGQCNMLPKVVPSSISDLTAHWGSCQNRVYYVNFALLHPQMLHALSAGSGSGGMLLGSGNAPGMKNPGPLGSPLSRQSSPAGTPALRQPGPTGTPTSKDPGPIATPGLKAPGPPSAGLRTPNKLSPPKQSQKITNPKAALRDAQILIALKKQRQAADAEARLMKLSIRPVAANVGPSQTMSLHMGSRTGQAPSTMQSAPATAPNSSSSGSRLPVSAVLPGPLQNLALTCAHNPTLRIFTVSGGPHPAIFTPDARYNFYTITGCSFGNMGPNSKAYIYYQGTFHEAFQIQEWSDNWIKLNLDPALTGVDDQNNVTLVIQRDDGKQTSKAGYKFYAARDTVLLRQIPRQYFSLNSFRTDQSVIQNWKPTYTSGSSSSKLPNLPGLSAEVHWDLTSGSNGSMVDGSDLYDFRHLHPSFVLESAWMEWKDLACASDHQFAASQNNWSINWYGDSGLQVGWQAQSCNEVRGKSCGIGWPDPSDCFAGVPESNYGVNVWVTGPRGLDPWTGKPSL